MNRLQVYFACVFVAGLVYGEALPRPRPGEKEAVIARTVAEQTATSHYLQQPVDDAASALLFEHYFNALDRDRTYFLAQDIERFTSLREQLDDLLLDGDVTFAFDAHECLISRVEERLAYVRSHACAPFDIHLDESIHTDRSEDPWCTDAARLDEVWRLRLKNGHISRIAKHVLAEKEQPKEDEDEDDGDDDDEDDDDDDESTGEKQSDRAGEADGAPDTDEAGAAPIPSVADITAAMETYDWDAGGQEIIASLDKYLKRLREREVLDILEIYLSTLVRARDPHSAYMAPATRENFDISMKLSLEGIGARLTSDEGQIKVVEVIAGGAAARDGRLQADDVIVAVAQEDEEPVTITNMPLRKVVSRIRGPKGTHVYLSVLHKDSDADSDPEVIDIVRAKIKLPKRAASIKYVTVPAHADSAAPVPVDDAETMTAGLKLGIITLPSFYRDFDAERKKEKNFTSAARDVGQLLAEAESKGVHGVLVDIRSNGGGSLDEAVALAGLFFEKGPVVQVKYAGGKIRVLKDKDGTVAYAGPLAVLVNRYSASASEIFAAAIQDYGRGIVIGDVSTHGKGTVQSLKSLKRVLRRKKIPFEDNPGTLKLTTAKFYRVNGSSTQHRGMVPDIIIPSYKDDLDIGESALRNAMAWDQIAAQTVPATFAVRAYVEEVGSRHRRRMQARYDLDAIARESKLYSERRKAKTKPLAISARLGDIQMDRYWRKKIKAYERGNGDKKGGWIIDEAVHVLADIARQLASQAAGSNAEPDTTSTIEPPE